MCPCGQRSFCFLRSLVFDLIILVLFSDFVGEQKVVAFISFCRRSREYKISRSLLLLFRWLCIIGPSDTEKCQCDACKKYVSAKDLVRRDRRDKGLCKTCAFQQCKCCGKEGELNLAQARKLHNSGEPWYSHLSLLTYLRSSNLRPQTFRPDQKLRG